MFNVLLLPIVLDVVPVILQNVLVAPINYISMFPITLVLVALKDAIYVLVRLCVSTVMMDIYQYNQEGFLEITWMGWLLVRLVVPPVLRAQEMLAIVLLAKVDSPCWVVFVKVISDSMFKLH